MSKYELAVVVSAKLEDDARAEVIEKVKALVTRFGGNITHFESETTTPGEIEERIRIMDGVIRYLCVKQEA